MPNAIQISLFCRNKVHSSAFCKALTDKLVLV